MPNTKKAVALGYDASTQNAPKVLAKGYGAIANEIIKKAEAYNINIFSNQALADSLIKLDLDDNIPVELYQSVAELFAWLANIENKNF